MASSKLSSYSQLPAPAILSVSQSKSHVLAGVQDAYWSDEEEDAECPLCLEEMDVSDLNFKPCVCGYQICRFCWHHIKENLNKRCPACRRIYTDDGVEFKPVATQDHKRLTQQKKQRDRERKELEVLGRKPLANVRVVQRNVVYVVGIGPRFAKEELIPTLRSNEYFGQYGKISKILIVKRTPPGGNGPVVGLYITYHRREDAARAIAAVDGAPSPGGGQEIMRASYGTTKYCMAFLRNVTCNDNSCMNLHEWGDQKDCFTKEDLSTLKHTMKTTENRTKTVVTKREEEAVSLPRAASWGQKSSTTNSAPVSSHAVSVTIVQPRNRRTQSNRQQRHVANSSQPAKSAPIPEKKPTPTVVQVSRPPTPVQASPVIPPPPAVPAPADVKPPPQKQEPPAPVVREASPAPLVATESEPVVQPPQQASLPSRPTSTGSIQSTAQPIVPIPSIPPGLSAPPGIPTPSRPPRTATDSPQTPLLASHSSYQMPTILKELMEDMSARRESALPAIGISPFPDFDRTLQSLSENDGGFSFNLDPKLADEVDASGSLAEIEAEANAPFPGSFLQAFPGLQPPSSVPTPPGLGFPNRSIYTPIPPRSMRTSPLSSVNYMGSFDPFADGIGARSQSTQPSETDDERKVSRFQFARGRHGGASLTSSPALSHASPHLTHTPSLYPAMMNETSIRDMREAPPGWPIPPHVLGLHNMPPGLDASPSHHEPSTSSRFQPFENNGAQNMDSLRQWVARERELQQKVSSTPHQAYKPQQQQFSDPAIMSASFGPSEPMFSPPVPYGPPPGLSMPSTMPPNLHLQGGGLMGASESNDVPPAPSPILSLSAADFPALVSNTPKEEHPHIVPTASLVPLSNKSQEKASRKAKKAEVQAEKLKQKAVAAAAVCQPTTEKAGQKDPLAKGPSSPAIACSPNQPNSASTGTASRSKVDTPSGSGATEPLKVEEKLSKKAKEKARKATAEATLKVSKQVDAPNLPPKQSARPTKPLTSDPAPPPPPAQVQVPLLSKKPKKNKPAVRVPKPVRDDSQYEEGTRTPGADSALGAPSVLSGKQETFSPSKSPDALHRLSLEELLEQIAQFHPPMDLESHPFFDVDRLGTIAKMPLEYGPLVHALSALSVGGGSFANNVPSGSIDTAVTSFQQLLETLTQTISDLLRLLPRTTWDDSSSFDGVLRDMLKGDDFLDETGDLGQERDDEVAALTLALERRARWMEVQLSKLEELHRDINTAAVRAVLSFNDNGWDKEGFLPRTGGSLKRFDELGGTFPDGRYLLTSDELEKELVAAKRAAMFAEAEIRESMNKLQYVKDFETSFV